eukprot:318409-Amphidinium_carterae.1
MRTVEQEVKASLSFKEEIMVVIGDNVGSQIIQDGVEHPELFQSLTKGESTRVNGTSKISNMPDTNVGVQGPPGY